MSAQNNGGPAFPSHRFETEGGDWVHPASSGMSLRDWFAGQAFGAIMGTAQGLGQLAPQERKELLATIVGLIYESADAMLAERNKTSTEGE